MGKMNIRPDRYLEDIEARLDTAQEERVLNDWFRWVNHENGCKALRQLSFFSSRS